MSFIILLLNAFWMLVYLWKVMNTETLVLFVLASRPKKESLCCSLYKYIWLILNMKYLVYTSQITVLIGGFYGTLSIKRSVQLGNENKLGKFPSIPFQVLYRGPIYRNYQLKLTLFWWVKIVLKSPRRLERNFYATELFLFMYIF